jgi:hypothetical protein
MDDELDEIEKRLHDGAQRMKKTRVATHYTINKIRCTPTKILGAKSLGHPSATAFSPKDSALILLQYIKAPKKSRKDRP